MGSLTWILARTSGLAAWAVLTASVLSGLLVSTRLLGRRVRRQSLSDLHTVLGIAGLGLVAVHLAALVADTYVPIDLRAILVPFASSWRPGPVTFGVISLWALLAVGLSTLARPQLRPHTWRVVHLASYLSYASATMHLVTAGTDAGNPYVLLVAGTSVVVVAGLSLLALVRHTRRPARVLPSAARAVRA